MGNCRQLAKALAIDLAKHNVEAAKDGRHVGQHVATIHEVHGLQVWETGSPNFAAIGPVAAIGHQVDAKFALRALHHRVGGTWRHVIALSKELEVMDQRFHRALHL